MPVFSYQTIQSSSEGIYKEKGSKFLAFAYPVTSEEEIKNRIESLKKEYYDARHHCFAWMLGAEKNQYRAFDDGEPNHSAGDPILGQIKSKNLTNVLVVVVRYFGGVKLGVGGLITAYKAAAEDALNKTSLIEREVTEVLQLSYSYSSTPEAMRLVKEFELNILSQDFNEDCQLKIEVKLRDKPGLLEKIKLLQVTGHDITFGL
ncbi:MAG TPA: YigZ family protein [Cyclobacteriaceae bacterium]|nr:YigZ family protein [Cyclobacteriaceae bacterium]